MNILDTIIHRKKEEISLSKTKISLQELRDTEFFNRENFSLKENIPHKSGIIAEFKRQSPSKGIINDKAIPLEVVSAYEQFGASGISILTDKDFFGEVLKILERLEIRSIFPFCEKILWLMNISFMKQKAWALMLFYSLQPVFHHNKPWNSPNFLMN